MQQLHHSFTHSEKLQNHMRCIYKHGSLFLVRNNCLLYHAAIPLNEDGSFTEVNIDGKTYKGRALMERLDQLIRRAYFGHEGSDEKSKALDYMWYLWCGPYSPLYNKDKMTTFERYFIKDEQLAKEEKALTTSSPTTPTPATTLCASLDSTPKNHASSTDTSPSAPLTANLRCGRAASVL